MGAIYNTHNIHILGWLLFFIKVGVIQYGLGEVSTAHKKIGPGHFHTSNFKTFCRMVLAVWNGADWLVLSKVSRTFFNIKIAQKYLMSSWDLYPNLYWITPHLWKKVITLMYISTFSLKFGCLLILSWCQI